MIEPLTRREREILALLEDLSLTNEEIAARLFLSVHSVKWYARQIYAKLGVSNRRAALARGRELGLLGRSLPAAPAQAGVQLPVELTSFIGRDREIGQLLQLLHEPGVRLVTITGPGGAGKTRLAQKIAGLLDANEPAFEIYLVELAGVSEAARVLERVAAALGLPGGQELAPVQSRTGLTGPPGGQAASLESIQAFLRPRAALLVLDNCEHLVEPCARLALGLLRSCPQLRLLATTRTVLGVPGEYIYELAPMAFPENSVQLTPELASSYEAVRLFVERARTALPGFELNADNLEAVIQICRQLEGLPLALELAAARVRLMSVAQIAARLEASLSLLAGGPAVLPQHKTMRASIEWSYNLLSPPERRLLARLPALGTEWSLETAEAVCSDPPPDPSDQAALPQAAVLQTLCGLVDKSLVSRIPTLGPQIHFRLLASIGEFAREKLEQSGELALLQRRYLAYLLQMPVHAEDLNYLMDLFEELSFNWDTDFLSSTERILWLATRFAEEAGIHGEALLHFRRGAVLHDIGKLLVPKTILEKPTSLTDEDWQRVKRHPDDSRRLLAPCPGFRQALEIAACHHELWDGSGYPRGLRGEEIPLSARVFTIINIWDALCADRPYRRAYSRAQASDWIRSTAGQWTDPHLAELFLALLNHAQP